MKTDTVKVIVVDDEQKALANLCYYLSRYCPLIEVIGTANTPEGALQLLQEHKPDVAFLDVEMHNDNIFSLLDMQKINAKFVFVTAYERYAIKAIKAEALDYILKPLSREDITACYEKIMKLFRAAPQPGAYSQELARHDTGMRKVIIRQGEHVFIVRQADIFYFKAKGFYTEILFDFKGAVLTALLSKPISAIEKEYDNSIFYRIHKSYVINTGKVSDIVKGESTTVKLSNDHSVPVAKRRVSDFLVFLNKSV